MTRQGLKIATVVLILVAEFVLTRISLTYRRQKKEYEQTGRLDFDP